MVRRCLSGFLLIVPLAFSLTTIPAVLAGEPRIQRFPIQTDWFGLPAMSALMRTFQETHEASLGGKTPMPRGSTQVLRSLLAHECDVGLLLASQARSSSAAVDLGKEFDAIPVGRFVIEVIVNKECPVHRVTVDDLARIYQGRTASWGEIRASDRVSRIELYAPLPSSAESCIFGSRVLGRSAFSKELLDQSVVPRRVKRTAEEIIGAVAKQRNAIGFFLFGYEGHLDKRVRVLAIAKDKDSSAVLPSVATINDGSYPLTDSLILYVSMDAPPATRDFCEFAKGAEAAKALRQCRLFPEREFQERLGPQRLAEVKAGKGVAIIACDLTGSEDFLKDLSLAFVKAKAVVQLKFQKGETRDTAIEKLAKGATELLLVDGDSGWWSVVSGQGKAALTPAFSQRTRGSDPAQSPIPNLQSPRSIELGRMAVAVIVHPENPLDSLPLDEAKSIFCGEVKKWPAVRGAAATMHVFGLKHTDSTAQLLKEKLVEHGRSLKYNTQPDNEKVILAVARDPAAIGFVDMSQLPPNEKSVKLVPVCEGTGKGKAPTSNPLSRTLTLYVSPNASQTAKDFADFLTPEHCKETIAQYNLLPPLHTQETKLAKAKPAREGPQIDLASANEPIPLLLDDPDAPQDQAKPRKFAAKPKPVIPAPEQPAPPKVTADAQPATETESEPAPTQGHPGSPSLSDDEIVWLVGSIVGVVVLALGVGWLRAPHRKRKRR